MDSSHRADSLPHGNVLWEAWVGTQSVAEFSSRVDAAVAAGKFPDRLAAFLAYAEGVLATLPGGERQQAAKELAGELLGHVVEVLGNEGGG